MPTRQFTAGEYPLGCPGWSVSEAAAPAAPHVTRCPWAVRRAPPGRPAVARSTKAGCRGPRPRPDAWWHDGRALAPPIAPVTRASPRPRVACESCDLHVMTARCAPVDEDAVGKGIHRPPMPSHQLSQGLDISLGDLANHAPVGR